MRAPVAACVVLTSLPAVAQTPPRTTVAGSADFAERDSSPAVRPNYGRLFSKASDGGLYYLSDTGDESNLLTGGASAASILASLLTVDGDGSTLDADLLDGISSGGFCLTDGTRVFTGNISFEGATADGFETSFAIVDPTGDRTITFKDESGTVAYLTDIVNMSAADVVAALITVDGAGSLVDSDFLDGVSSAGYLQTATGGDIGGTGHGYLLNLDTDTASTALGIANHNAAGLGPTLQLYGSRGTHASPSQTQNGDSIGNINAVGRVDTLYATSGAIIFRASENWDNSGAGSKIIFQTTPNRSFTNGTALTLNQDKSADFAGVANFAASNTYQANDITDADVVDTITASNYAALAGGNTFASSNSYAADDITDADVVNTITASLYALLTGATFTGQIILSNIATDITAAVDEALTIKAQGTGVINLFASTGEGAVISKQGSDSARFTWRPAGYGAGVIFSVGTSGTRAMYLDDSLGATMRFDGGLVNDSTTAPLTSQRFAGPTAGQTLTITTDTATQPSATSLRLTLTGDTAFTPSKTNAQDGMMIRAVNVSAFNLTMTDLSGTYEGGATPCVLNQWDSVSFHYSTDRWVEDACNNN